MQMVRIDRSERFEFVRPVQNFKLSKEIKLFFSIQKKKLFRPIFSIFKIFKKNFFDSPITLDEFEFKSKNYFYLLNSFRIHQLGVSIGPHLAIAYRRLVGY